MRVIDWVLEKLEPLSGEPFALLRDPHRLAPLIGDAKDEQEKRDASRLSEFASQNGITVIAAGTNLVFRESYEAARADPLVRKILIIDRTPLSRRQGPRVNQAAALFYPDLLARIPQEARIELDMRRLLIERTNDSAWPNQANEPRYARLIARHLEYVLQAHQRSRAAHPRRFNDADFQRIVAFAALGVPDAVAKRDLEAADYWKIGLQWRETQGEVSALTPEATERIKGELAKAPTPFSWLASRDPGEVSQALFLSAILAQHLDQWHDVLAVISPALAQLGTISDEMLRDATPQFIKLDPDQARRELDYVERELTSETLQTLLVERLHILDSAGFTGIIEREHYSTLIRSLALFSALANLLGPQPDSAAQAQVYAALSGRPGNAFVESRKSDVWDHLKALYLKAHELGALRAALERAIRDAGVIEPEKQTFAWYWQRWNGERINQIEYVVSQARRQIDTDNLLPRLTTALPAIFGKTLQTLQQRILVISDDVYARLDDLNRPFQTLIARRFPEWVKGGATTKQSGPAETTQLERVILTSQFIASALKPNWDDKTERAAVFVFDGMRYDMWDALLRPLLDEYMEVVDDPMASALLPSKTHISRWALAAGDTPNHFHLNPRRAENIYLKDALARVYAYQGDVRAQAAGGSGVGQTVRYHGANLDYYIFEFIDHEMHDIAMKQQANGRLEPTRSLAMVYDQIRDFLRNEVMAIVRQLTPGTKVFVTSDHGFGSIRNNWIPIDNLDLNRSDDCTYRATWLKTPIQNANIDSRDRDKLIVFTPDQLGMPRSETVENVVSRQSERHEYKAIIFPKVGYAFSRRGRNSQSFKAAGYSHGGVSLQEMLIPMVALRVKPQDESLLTLTAIEGPKQPVEGEELEYRLRIRPGARFGANGQAEIPVTVEASYRREGAADAQRSLPPQTYYVTARGDEVVVRFTPSREEADASEQRVGAMRRRLTISASYRDGLRPQYPAQTFDFTVQLNTERVARRVPASLGGILGMMPKRVN